MSMQHPEIDPNTPLGKLSLRALRVPAFIRIPLLFIGLAATLTCCFADLPPYSTLADLQASVMDGEHYYMLSFIGTAAVFMMPIGLTIHFIATFFPPAPPVAYPGAQGGYPGQAPYGGQPGYPGQAPYGGQPGYPGQAPYGQAPYGQAPYGQTPSGPQAGYPVRQVEITPADAPGQGAGGPGTGPHSS
ncbi:MAG: hypothetical protein U0441_15840 [Polyangiaceae bacterium]